MASQRPGQLTAIAIMALVLGLVGTCGGLWGLGGTLLQSRLQEAQQGWLESSGMPAEQVEAQRAMQARFEQVQREWLPLNVTHQSLNLLASALLLASGVLLLRTSAKAPRLFLLAVAANLVVDLGGAVLAVAVQRDTQEVMRRMMADVGAGAPGADRVFEGMMQAGVWVGVCVAGAWLLVKVAFYVWGVVYLRRPDVRRLFAESDGEASPANWREAP